MYCATDVAMQYASEVVTQYATRGCYAARYWRLLYSTLLEGVIQYATVIQDTTEITTQYATTEVGIQYATGGCYIVTSLYSTLLRTEVSIQYATTEYTVVRYD